MSVEIHDAMGNRRAAACCENVKMSRIETHLAFIKAIYGKMRRDNRVRSRENVKKIMRENLNTFSEFSTAILHFSLYKSSLTFFSVITHKPNKCSRSLKVPLFMCRYSRLFYILSQASRPSDSF